MMEFNKFNTMKNIGQESSGKKKKKQIIFRPKSTKYNNRYSFEIKNPRSEVKEGDFSIRSGYRNRRKKQGNS